MNLLQQSTMQKAERIAARLAESKLPIIKMSYELTKTTYETGKAAYDIFNAEYDIFESESIKAYEIAKKALDANGNQQMLKAGEDFKKYKQELLFGSNVEIIQNFVSKSYLPAISKKYQPIDPSVKNYSYSNRVRVLQVKRWVTDQNEDALDKLNNVYSALSGVECSIALVYRREKQGTGIYFVIANQSNMIDPAVVDSYFTMFLSALKGNFPGAEVEEIPYFGTYQNTPSDSLIGQWFSESNSNAVAMITNISSESSEKFLSQGIEKLLDGVVPEDDDTEYTLVLLAEPMTKSDLFEQKCLYEDMYTQLSPFESTQIGLNINDAVTSTENISKNISKTKGSNIGLGVIVANAGGNKGSSIGLNYGFSKGDTKSSGESITSTRTNYRVKETLQTIEMHLKRLQQGEALGMWNFASYVLADNYSVAQSVSSMYRSLTEGEESFIESAAINIWNDNRRECKEDIDVIQAYLKAFTHPVFALRGTEALTTNNDFTDKKERLSALAEYIKTQNAEDILCLPNVVSGFTRVAGKELAMSMNLPGAAVSGVPVIECAAFGRDVISQSLDYGKDQAINVGNIFHMQQEEIHKAVCLDAKCMTEHTFVTGSTGAGKSTTIYRILAEASGLKTDNGKHVTFLVIEPAKGEYKNEIAQLSRHPVNVYGTNPKMDDGELLRINPFAFPDKKIHILEHLDRLIEIFNVCWPMYAAMPAILKKGIENAYESCGWDLLNSENKTGYNIYPTFEDVCNHIRIAIDQSDYSAENKGDYKGALVTRLESLTNGINGLIFTADAIDDQTLFENNSIVDLSRVGSTETKALIMGLLVMKLQEYRMASSEQPNAKLKHITVLEEAHNLLKRTSTEQSAEGSNLLGKSVEMLSNSIAEMRTYGEAFIIADQAPGLLDMSVIRNTNTKIIMRLPDFSDRELVGKAANLNDEQIVELAKLRPGVAAIYYNGWINPVLCKVQKSSLQEQNKAANTAESKKISPKDYSKTIVNAIVHRGIPEKTEMDILVHDLICAGYPGELAAKFCQFCYGEPIGRKKLIAPIVYLLFKPSKLIKDMKKVERPEQITGKIVDALQLQEYNINSRDIETLVFNMLHEQNIRDIGYAELYTRFSTYFAEKYRIGGRSL